MQIDRGRFLLLTAALTAATSCRRIRSELSPDPAPAAPSAQSAPSATTGTPAAEGLDAAAAATAFTALGDEAPASDAGREGGTAQAPRPRGDGGVSDCNDLLPGGPQCEGFGIVRSWCADSRKVLTAEAQGKVLACLATHSGKATICSSFLNRECDVQVFRGMAPDPAAAAECEKIVAKCAPRPAVQFRGGLDAKVTQQSCQQVFAAAKPSMRARVTRCMSEDCQISWCAVESTR